MGYLDRLFGSEAYLKLRKKTADAGGEISADDVGYAINEYNAGILDDDFSAAVEQIKSAIKEADPSFVGGDEEKLEYNKDLRRAAEETAVSTQLALDEPKLGKFARNKFEQSVFAYAENFLNMPDEIERLKKLGETSPDSQELRSGLDRLMGAALGDAISNANETANQMLDSAESPEETVANYREIKLKTELFVYADMLTPNEFISEVQMAQAKAIGSFYKTNNVVMSANFAYMVSPVNDVIDFSDSSKISPDDLGKLAETIHNPVVRDVFTDAFSRDAAPHAEHDDLLKEFEGFTILNHEDFVEEDEPEAEKALEYDDDFRLFKDDDEPEREYEGFTVLEHEDFVEEDEPEAENAPETDAVEVDDFRLFKDDDEPEAENDVEPVEDGEEREYDGFTVLNNDEPAAEKEDESVEAEISDDEEEFSVLDEDEPEEEKAAADVSLSEYIKDPEELGKILNKLEELNNGAIPEQLEKNVRRMFDEADNSREAIEQKCQNGEVFKGGENIKNIVMYEGFKNALMGDGLSKDEMAFFGSENCFEKSEELLKKNKDVDYLSNHAHEPYVYENNVLNSIRVAAISQSFMNEFGASLSKELGKIQKVMGISEQPQVIESEPERNRPEYGPGSARYEQIMEKFRNASPEYKQRYIEQLKHDRAMGKVGLVNVPSAHRHKESAKEEPSLGAVLKDEKT